jgi:hypothetical protein
MLPSSPQLSTMKQIQLRRPPALQENDKFMRVKILVDKDLAIIDNLSTRVLAVTRLGLIYEGSGVRPLQKKGICSSVFLYSSGSMFIIENMFLGLKTDVHNLCTSVRPRNIRWIIMFLSQVRSPRNITTYFYRLDRPGQGT